MSNNKSQAEQTDGFYLNQCWVSVADNHIYFDQCSIKLEPKVVQVLACLAEQRGKVVDKAFLIEQVWKDRVVADDSLVRCISVLRKHFKNNQVLGVGIDTVAKKGYRLTVNESPESLAGRENQANEQPIAQPIPAKPFKWLILGLPVMAVVLLFLFKLSTFTDSPEPIQYQRTVLLASAERERYPELSADGFWLTYAQSTTSGMAIFVKSLSDRGVQQITSGEFYDHQPTFTADARQIVFARITATNQCEIRLISIIGGVDKKLADCASQGVYSMVWSPLEQSVYFVDKTSSIAKGQLQRLNIETGEQATIPLRAGLWKAAELARSDQQSEVDDLGADQLAVDSLGVDDLAISHSGTKLAVALSPLLGVEDIFVADIARLEFWKRLSFKQTKIHGMAFSADDQSLFLSSNRSGPFRLWQTSLANGATQLIDAAIPNVSEISISRGGKIALERWTESSQVQSVDWNTGLSTIVPSKNVNWGAQKSPVGPEIVFLSNRSGHAELWLQSGQSTSQLTHFNGPWLMSPSWSIDGQSIAFSSNQLAGAGIHIYQLETQQVVSIAGSENSSSPLWHPSNKQLYFLRQTQTGEAQSQVVTEVVKWDPVSEQTSVVKQMPAKALKFGHNGQWFFSRPNQPGIWQVEPDQPAVQLVDDLELVDWNNWAVSQDELYYIKRDPLHGSQLIKKRLDNLSLQQVMPIKQLLYFSGLQFEPTSNSIWLATIDGQDADIDLLTH